MPMPATPRITIDRPAGNDAAHRLLEKLRARQATIGVVGLGYVGLPLCRLFVAQGIRTIGFDIDESKIMALRHGNNYITHYPGDWIAPAVAQRRFIPTDQFALASECDAIAICVPTPLTEAQEPDLTYIRQTGISLAPHLKSPSLVVLESTTYPGTTREVLLPILQADGRRTLGKDLFMAFSPEREDPGNPQHSTGSVPKIVGGLDADGTDLAEAMYAPVVPKIVRVSSAEVAESAKLLENIYRCVNIALANEMKLILDAMGIDVWEVIEAASTKPFGFSPFYPGPGLGGHCIPIDPYYLAWRARQFERTTRFIELAGEINRMMPEYVVRRLQDALNDARKALNGSRILLIGMAYKKNVGDLRESPSLQLVHLLKARGATVAYHDPHIPHAVSGRHGVDMKSVPLSATELRGQDAVVIVTDHDDIDYPMLLREAPLVVDTRNVTRKITPGQEKVVRA